jgi:hypothetical protein
MPVNVIIAPPPEYSTQNIVNNKKVATTQPPPLPPKGKVENLDDPTNPVHNTEYHIHPNNDDSA